MASNGDGPIRGWSHDARRRISGNQPGTDADHSAMARVIPASLTCRAADAAPEHAIRATCIAPLCWYASLSCSGGGIVQRIVVVGTGQLGTALAGTDRDDLVILNRRVLDITQEEQIESVLGSLAPAVVINAAAYNRVDDSEKSPEVAFAINAIAPGRLARVATALAARFVHISTDYVFSGDLNRPYREDDLPMPLGVYGASKLAGEHLVQAYAPGALIARTSGLFGVTRRRHSSNFVGAILRQARGGAPLRVVADKTASPTYAVDLAVALLALVDQGTSGIVHITNQGSCTWHALACAILEEAGLSVPVEAVATTAVGDVARRPLYSVLDLGHLASHGVTMPHWRDALRRYMTQLGEAGRAQG